MESTGEATQVHLSGAFADFIAEKNNPHADQYLIVPRDTETFVKGKGNMSTAYLYPSTKRVIENDYRDELAHIDSLCAKAAHDRSSNDKKNEDGGSGTASSDDTGAGVRFGAFNVHSVPAAHFQTDSEAGSVAIKDRHSRSSRHSASSVDHHESRWGGTQDGYAIRSVSSMSGLTASVGFRGNSSLISKSNNSSNTGASAETADLLKRFAALEMKFNDAMTARHLVDDDKRQAEKLLLDTGRKAAALREKNALIAQRLRESQKAVADDKVKSVVAEVELLAAAGLLLVSLSRSLLLAYLNSSLILSPFPTMISSLSHSLY